MKKAFIATALVLFLSVIFNIKQSGAGDPYPYAGKRFLAGDLAFADAPTGHVPGKDNFITTSPNRFHNQGDDCGICHAPGRKAAVNAAGADITFTVAGTMYKDKMGREPLEGAEVIFVDAASNVISCTTDKAGNFYTQTPIASDPASGLAADNPSSWRYKNWIKYGDQVIPMITIAPVGGMSTPRMGCGMHHNPKGARGALFIDVKPTLATYPATNISFKKHVLPIFRAKCKSCHLPRTTPTGNMHTYTTTHGATAGQYQYDGGLNLMSYSATGLGGTSSVKGVSQILGTLLGKTTKPLGNPQSVQHAGGWFWTETDADYKVIKQWIVEGALDN